MHSKTFVSSFLRFFVPALLFTGCAGNTPDTPPPAWIVGKYHYAGNGVAAKKFPWDAKSDLVLDRDGQYTLAVTVHINDDEGGDTDSDESYGSYYVEGNKLVLVPAHEGDNDELDGFEIHGNRLVPNLGWGAKLLLKGLKVPDPVFVKSEDHP